MSAPFMFDETTEEIPVTPPLAVTVPQGKNRIAQRPTEDVAPEAIIGTRDAKRPGFVGPAPKPAKLPSLDDTKLYSVPPPAIPLAPTVILPSGIGQAATMPMIATPALRVETTVKKASDTFYALRIWALAFTGTAILVVAFTMLLASR
jgi:hypothetical protein